MDPWELLQNDKICEQMILLGCDRKYIDGHASDFEKFKELCSVFFMLEGNDAAKAFLNKLSNILGRSIHFDEICESRAKSLWRQVSATQGAFYEDEAVTDDCDEKSNIIRANYAKNECVKKENNFGNILDLNLLIGSKKITEIITLDKLCRYIENQDVSGIRLRLENADFIKPNRYHAEQVLRAVISGEKCNLSKYNLLLCQIICELIFAKMSGILQLYLDCQESFEPSNNLIKYLSSRKLSARIFLLVSAESSVENIKATCLLGAEYCFTTPVLIKKETDTKESSAAFLQSLSRVYPSYLIEL